MEMEDFRPYWKWKPDAAMIAEGRKRAISAANIDLHGSAPLASPEDEPIDVGHHVSFKLL